MQKHKIALDVGDVRIGVAVSDLLGITANPRETYVRKKGDTAADIAYFANMQRKKTPTRSFSACRRTWTARKDRERKLPDSLATCLKSKRNSRVLSGRKAHDGVCRTYAYRRRRKKRKAQKSHRQGCRNHNFAGVSRFSLVFQVLTVKYRYFA